MSEKQPYPFVERVKRNFLALRARVLEMLSGISPEEQEKKKIQARMQDLLWLLSTSGELLEITSHESGSFDFSRIPDGSVYRLTASVLVENIFFDAGATDFPQSVETVFYHTIGIFVNDDESLSIARAVGGANYGIDSTPPQVKIITRDQQLKPTDLNIRIIRVPRDLVVDVPGIMNALAPYGNSARAAANNYTTISLALLLAGIPEKQKTQPASKEIRLAGDTRTIPNAI